MSFVPQENKSGREERAKQKDPCADVLPNGDVEVSFFSGDVMVCPHCGCKETKCSDKCQACGYLFAYPHFITDFKLHYGRAKSKYVKIALIHNEKIPHNKDAALMFFYFAASQIGKSRINDLQVDKAWQTKLEQLYGTLGEYFSDVSEMKHVKSVYQRTKLMKKVWIAKFFVEAVLIILGMVILCQFFVLLFKSGEGLSKLFNKF